VGLGRGFFLRLRGVGDRLALLLSLAMSARSEGEESGNQSDDRGWITHRCFYDFRPFSG
jgi:hypothetical protein